MKECEQAKHVLGLLEKLGKLDKTAQDKTAQEITHKKLDASQPTIGNEMQKEIEEGCQGNYASDKSVNASIANGTDPSPKKVEGDDDKKAAKVLSETGTAVKDMYPCGSPAGTPSAVVNKSAAMQFKTRIEACVKSEMEKEAAYRQAVEMQKQAAAANEDVTTATEVLAKVASLNEVKTQEDFVKLASDIQVSFEDLRRTNPLFNIAVEHKMMEKMAAEIDALAAENGMSPEDAAAALDEATANDPEAAGEMQSEAEGEALSDLADAEQDQAAFMDGLDGTAAQVSEMLGTEVTGDDIANAVEQVVEMADQMGVEPEVLLQAAVEEMTGGAGDEPSEEDRAQAQQIMDAAAAQGISPEEVVDAVSQQLDGADGAEAAPEAPEAPAEGGEDMEKEASLQRQEVLIKLASTKRGANLLKVLNRKA